MSASRAPIWLVLKAHLRADARKTGVLVVLILAMVVIYARLFFASGVPSSAGASSGVAVPAAGLTPSGTEAPRHEPGVLAERVTLPAPPSRKLNRDPFGIDLGKFASAIEPAPGLPGLPAESAPKNPEEEILAAARELVFQGIVHETDGKTAIACINDQIVRPGEQIAGFVVQRVEPTRVVLQREDVRVVLNLR